MKRTSWYFDFISPFAYLQIHQFNRLPANLEVTFKPVLFAGLLNHWGSKGPAEIPAKRTFTYRHVLWMARRAGIAMHFPSSHPFNPLKALRLAIAAGNSGEVVTAIFHYLWRDGGSLEDIAALQKLAQRFGVADVTARIGDPQVKAALRSNTEEAATAGIFGVPTFLCEDRLFWGLDSTDMFLDYLQDPSRFDDEEMRRVDDLPTGASRI